MSLLKEIQQALLDGGSIGPILLKLRFLASRLGSDQLEEWVKYESEGYPSSVELPEYRKIPVAYKGTFTGGFGSRIENAPIPPYLIGKHAGEHWVYHGVRDSVAAIDALVGSGKNGSLHLAAADLILLLQGHVYEGYACNDVTGTIATASLIEIQSNVRAKALELTIQLERRIPGIVDIGLYKKVDEPPPKERDVVSSIINNIVHGNLTNISSVGSNSKINVNVGVSNKGDFVEALAQAGVSLHDAEALGEILATENPENGTEPFGKKAKAWLIQNIGKAVDGTWAAGMSVATQVITEAAMKYYGLK